ncbi:MAG: hypothetical protein M3P04_06020 [Actinomycetota bacterium]|nr:hypothetical protein [Actinomycetota bacterium]
MHRLAGLIVGALVLTSQVPPATAARTVCRTITDDVGDAAWPDFPELRGVPGDDGDDLVTADVASDGTQLTAVWRLVRLRQPNSSAPLGQTFTLEFRATGSPLLLYLSATNATLGPTYSFGYFEDVGPLPQARPLGTGRGVFDVVHGEVRMTVATRGFAPARVRIVRGTRLTSLSARSGRVVHPGAETPVVAGQHAFVQPDVLSFDRAEGSRYVVGTPSCVRPVR